MDKLHFDVNDSKSRSKTQQNFRDVVNINTIMAKAKRTGFVPVKGETSYFGDFTNVTDFREMVTKVKGIEHLFESLPAKIRNRFRNNPAEILDFLNDPDKDAESRELGLRRPYTHDEQVALGLIEENGKVIEKPKENTEA